jgi:hypothetical protein
MSILDMAIAGPIIITATHITEIMVTLGNIIGIAGIGGTGIITTTIGTTSHRSQMPPDS